MIRLLIDWANINSGSSNLPGLSRLADSIASAFAPLGGEVALLDLPPAESIDCRGELQKQPVGKAISIRKRSEAPLRILLNIHYDTVYAADHPFQQARPIDEQTLCGPGVADAKGGLVVLLTALRAVEQVAERHERFGWEVLINPDEEISSLGSAPLLAQAANRNHFGLLFEPAMPDGNLVGQRKGAGTFTFVVRGRAAHAGRDFHAGRSAILALAALITRIDAEQSVLPAAAGITINCGRIEGGGAVNVVPDLAIARFNARASSAEGQHAVEALMRRAGDLIGRREGIRVALHGGFSAPPKPLDARSTHLMDLVIDSARQLGMNLSHRPSGGASDGNRLAAAGLPLVDTMGPVGGELHSEHEYVRLDSLVPRAKLAAMTIMRLAMGQIPIT
jgi:glutamate carboxypeptidase